MEDPRHIRLTLEVVRKTSHNVAFQIDQQTLRGNEFNSSVPAELQLVYNGELNPFDYPEETADDMLNVIDLMSDDSITVSPYTFYVRGDDEEYDQYPETVSMKRWQRILRSVLQYNQLYNKNTLTEKDVIWNPTASQSD
jgi:hypothetical protein